MDKSSDLSDKFNKEIEKQATKAGKKVAEQKIQQKLGELDKKTEEHLHGIKEKLSNQLEKGGFSLVSSSYFLITLEQLPVLALLMLIYFFSTVLSVLLYFVAIIVAGVYLVSYFLINRFSGLLKGSLGFLLAIILSVCEAIFLSYLCQVVETAWLIIIVLILIIVLLIITALSKALKHKYKAIIGISVGFSVTLLLYILYGVVIGISSWTEIIVTYILASLYQFFLVFITCRIIDRLEYEEEDFKTSVFVSLVVYTKKVDYTLGLIWLLIKGCGKCCKKKDNY
jgi:hypothetical protein